MTALVAFVVGAATMVIEIAAARVLAPILGVSLYSWTAVIGVVLAGLATGGWLCGLTADRIAPRRVVVAACAIGAFGALAAPSLSAWAGESRLIGQDAVLARTLLTAVATLAVPSLGLGAVVPGLVRLELRREETAGRTVGTIYAAGTLGSIVGVFSTGLVLVETIGSGGAIVAAGACLLLVALALATAWDRPARALVGMALLAPFVLALGSPAQRTGPCQWESAYFCIQILEEQVVGPERIRALKLDRLIHGAIHPGDPTFLARGYARVMGELLESLPRASDPRVLFIGGGSYTLPRYMEARRPGSELDVIEIDPTVTRAAHAFLGLRPDTRVRSHWVDARQFFLAVQPRQVYDVVVGDAFNDLSVPYHLTTREFGSMVRDSLAPDGLYVANVVDTYPYGRFFPSFVATLRTIFPHVDLVVDDATAELKTELEYPMRKTFILVASEAPAAWERLESLPGRSSFRVRAPDLEAYVSRRGPIVLTDDHAPVDALLAPVFLARGF